MGQHRRVVTMMVVVMMALGVWWAGAAGAVPAVRSVTTSADYKTVTVTFTEAVTGSGGGAVVAADVTTADTGATLTTVSHSGAVVTLGFGGPVQPATGVITFFAGTNRQQDTGVPVADGDWAVINAALRGLTLPGPGDTEVPIAAGFFPGEDDPARTLSDLLPATTPSSLDLPDPIAIRRNGNGTFTVALDDAAPITTLLVPVSVDVMGTPSGPDYLLSMEAADLALAVSLDGTVDLDARGAVTGGTLAMGLAADPGVAQFTGAVGPVAAESDIDVVVDATLTFDVTPIAAPATTTGATTTAVTGTAGAEVSRVLIAGLGAGGTDILAQGTPLADFSWASLPTSTTDNSTTPPTTTRTETVTATDGGWAAAGLGLLANVGLNDVLGAPGALATWLLDAQGLGVLDTDLPLVGTDLGDVIGIAESIGMVQNQLAAALAVAVDPFFELEQTVLLSPTLCEDLRTAGVLAERMTIAISQALATDPDLQGQALEDAAKALYQSVTVNETVVGDDFVTVCRFFHGAVSLDLAAESFELDIDIAPHDFVFLDPSSPAPALDLSFEDASLGDLAVAVTGGTWSGVARADIDFTLGVKLASDTALFDDLDGVGLVVDLDDEDDSTPADAGDITAAHRIYVPAGDPVASAGVALTGTGLSGTAQVGFLDLGLAGEVSITPTVGLTPLDPSAGFADGKLDLAEMLSAVSTDGAGLDTILEIGLTGDDVDAAFTLTNNIVAVTADVAVAGDLTGLLPGGTVEFRTTAISGPDDADPNTLVVAQTFGDGLDLANMSPLDVMALVADSLDGIAQRASAGAGDQRIPLVDVSLDEVAGFTAALSDVATTIRDRAPRTISELQAFVNDALEAQGLGTVTVAFDPTAPGGGQLTLTVDADMAHTAAYPVSFSLEDSLGPLEIAPSDGGATLQATVEVDFTPVLGIKLDDSLAIADRVFVRDVTPRFAFRLSGDVEGAVTLGPLEASLTGAVAFGGLDPTDGITASLTTDSGDTTVPLSALRSGDVTVGVTGQVPVSASITLDVPLLDTTGVVGLSGTLPGTVTFSSDLDIPDLRDLLSSITLDLGTLADGAVQTARFIARGSDEAAGLASGLPVIGDDVRSGLGDVSDVMDQVADEVEAVIATLQDGEDATVVLERELDALLQGSGCTDCDADVSWVGDETSLTILNAQGIEVLLTIEDSTGASTSTSASLGLDPVVEVGLDITSATADIGYRATIGLGLDRVHGFYLFPGDDGDDTNGTGNLLELYAGLSLQSDISLTLAGVQATAPGASVVVGGPLNDGTAAGLRVQMADRLPFTAIVNRSRSFSDTVVPTLAATVTASLPVTFPVDLGGGTEVVIGFPLTLDWSFADTLRPSLDTAQVAITNATLDASSLTGPIADLLEEFDASYNPLGIPQIKGVLTTELPLVEIRVRDALLAACRLANSANPAPCTAFDILTDINGLVTTLRGDSNTGAIALGSFQIYPAPADGSPRYSLPSAAFAQSSPSATGINAKILAATGGYMSLPILDNFPAIMGIALGGELATDVDFVRFEIPQDRPIVLGKSFNLRQELFNLDIGFIQGNLTVAVNGKLGLSVAGGFGYSSRGLRTGNAEDGIFVIDGPGNEIEIGAAINASVDGSFDVIIAAVRFRGAGGLSIGAGIDLFDESPVLAGRGGGDGRLNVDEISTIGQAYNPPLPGLPSELCMFQLRTTGSWYLRFSGKLRILGITVFNESFNEGGTLFDETIRCSLRTRIAKVEDRQLILLGGPHARDRYDGEGDVDERFRVTPEGPNLRVTWLGTPAKNSMTFPVAGFDTIVADLGTGADSVEVDDAITMPLIGRGGPGIDTITGGGGPDDLDGGPDGDNVNGRSGADTLRGGPGGDRLDGGPGEDAIDGGGDGDTVHVTDGADTDTLDDTGTSGVDTLDLSALTTALVGDASFGESRVRTTGVLVTYPSATVEAVVGGTQADTFTFKDQEPDGFTFDGAGGGDAVTFLAGRRDRTVGVHDSGTDATDVDTMTILGTATPDRFLLRAASTQPGQTASDGLVARIAGQMIDRYDYDDTVEDLTVDGGPSRDTFSLDDNAAKTHIVGGQGNDVIQVGQIYGKADCQPVDTTLDGACTVDPSAMASIRGGAAGVGVGDAFATTVITRGHLSNGVTHDLVIDAGDDEDSITIFSNRASVVANAGPGNDRIVARAFVVTASIQLNGDGEVDDFQYVINDQIAVDGGAGVDTFTVIGTELNDGFIIGVGTDGLPLVKLCPLQAGIPTDGPGCAINAVVDNVEVFEAIGLEGDDVFLITATAATSRVDLSGGAHSDTVIVGDGTLNSILGPVLVSGDKAGDVPDIPLPVVLPGEDATPAFAPAIVGGTDRGDELIVDASTDPANLDGEVTDLAVRGFGMAAGPFTIGTAGDAVVIDEVLTYEELEFMTVDLGPGADRATVTSTHVGNGTCDADGCPLTLSTGDGPDAVDVLSIAGRTILALGSGADSVTVGQPTAGGDSLDQIDAGLVVDGGADADVLDLDDTADGPSRLDVDPGLLTQAGLAVDGVTHAAVETVHIRLGTAADVVNVRGTAADASTATHVHAGDGDDRLHVSSAADLDLSTSTDHLGGDVDDVAGPLVLHADGGTSNEVMVSDREAAVGDGAIAYDGALLTGLAPASISHDTTGAFGHGITLWTSEHTDTLQLTGTDRSSVVGTRTLTTINTGDGGDDLTVDLAAGTDGPVVLDTEEGDDTVDGSTSTLGLIVLGGLGPDTITTGSGPDLVLGDLGRARTADGATVVGGGGPGDVTDGGTQPIDRLTSEPAKGAADTIITGGGADVVVAGLGADTVHGGSGDDLLIGGHVAAGGTDSGDTIDAGPGRDVIAGDNAILDRTVSPPLLRLHDVVTTTTPAPAGSGGADTVNAGPDDDLILGQQGADRLSGDEGADTIEGNSGSDTIAGGPGQDDLLGGGSAFDGVMDDDRTWVAGGVALADENDTIDGDGDADVIIGDNGWIVRSTSTLADVFGARNPSYDGIVVRDARVSRAIDPDRSYGADLIRGGDGHDEIHGQMDTTRATAGGITIAGDELDGGRGDDVIVGDLGHVRTVLEDGSRRRGISDNASFLEASLHDAGTLTREVELYLQQDGDHVTTGDRSDATQFGTEGDDLMLGGEGDDRMHGGGGDDVANGGPGRDVVFGGDGQDALWGGPDDDELFGGHDRDSLDVMPRSFTTTTNGRDRQTLGPDPAIWFQVAPTTAAMAGLDVVYGGWDTDEMQADVKTNGQRPGDRLVDWAGAYNRYLSCSNGGGAGTFLRGASPSVRAFVTDLAEGRGAVTASVGGSSGYRELGLVEQSDIQNNTGSAGGDGHVACP